MKILHISDTHNCHRQLKNLPEADVIVHSGDVTMNGKIEEVLDFLNWFAALPYGHKLFVEGNHDTSLFKCKINGLPDNLHFLQDEAIRIDGINFFGISMKRSYGSEKSGIPGDTDVVISHEPPFGILDFADEMHYGDGWLMDQLKQLQPRLHLFGHIHPQYGMKTVGLTTFVNSALLGDGYELENTPHLLEL